MRIVIPVSASDVHLLPDFLAAMIYTGGLEDHFVTWVPTPTVYQQVKEAAEKLSEICPNVNVVGLPEEPVGGWPSACNNHFAHTTKIAANQADRLPWLWMELDTVGLEGWANKLSNAYSNLGNSRSFMGFVQPHYRISAATRQPVQPPGDDRMSGVAIYPVDMAERTKFGALLTDLGYGNRTDNQSFDEYLRFEIKGKGSVRAHTNLIEDKWNTVNYRVEDGQLTCDSGPKDRSERERGGPVNPQAVLIHGCKDGSLHRLVAAGKAPSPSNQPIRRLEPNNILAAKREGTGSDDRVLAMLASISDKISNIETRVAKVEKAPVAEVKVEKPAIVVSPPPSFLTPPITEGAGSLTSEMLLTFLTSTPKSQTVKSVSEHFGVSKETVEEIITAENSGFSVSGPASWVKVAEPAAV